MLWQVYRDLPLLHPPGSGYDLNLLGSKLSDPPLIGLLPPSTFILQPPASVLRLPHVSQNNATVFLPQDSEHGNVILIPIGHTG